MLLSASAAGNGTELPFVEAPSNITSEEAPVLEATSGWDSTSLAYVFVPLSLVICIGLATALVVFLVRKSRLDRLRHHLMPFYSFDPQDEGEDWEAELLEEGLTHRPNPANKVCMGSTKGRFFISEALSINALHTPEPGKLYKNPEFHEPPKLAFRSVL